MAAPIKVMITALKAIFMLAIGLILLLGIIGGGWGVKQIPIGHPFYSGETLLIAHRGVSDSVPENTFASARRALELGFEVIEIDIKKSKDNRFYLFHDRESSRLLGDSIALNEKTLAEIQALPLLYKGKPTDHRVPEFEAFIREFSPHLNFYLDVKRHGNNRYHRLSGRIYEFLDKHNLTQRSLVGSDFLFTAYLEFQHPEIHTVFTGPGNWLIIIYRCIPKKFRPDFIIGYADHVTAGHLKWLKRNGLLNRRMLYGINENNYQEVKHWGIPILVVEYDPVMDEDIK